MSSIKNFPCVIWINSVNLTVQDAGIAQLDSLWNEKGVCAPFTRVYFIRSGQGTLAIRGKQVPLRANHAYLIPSWTVFDYSCSSYMEQVYFHVFFQQPSGLDLFSVSSECCQSKLSQKEMDDLAGAFLGSDVRQFLKVQFYLYKTVLEMSPHLIEPGSQVHNYSQLVLDVFEIVQENLSSQLSIGKLAGKLQVSASMLTKRFSAETGLSLGRYINQLLVQEIQRRLLFSDETVSEISRKLQFCDPFYMSRFFKTRTDLSPLHYRKRLKGPFEQTDSKIRD